MKVFFAITLLAFGAFFSPVVFGASNGDANGDGKIDSLDLKVVLAGVGKSASVLLDQIPDNKINLFDFTFVKNSLGNLPTTTPTVAPPGPTPPIPPPANTFAVSKADGALFYGPFQGFGAEWDPFFWNINNQSKGLDEADWNLILNRVHEMQLPLIRVWTQLYFATNDPDGNVWNFENRRMQSLFRQLDFACQNNIDVALTDWGWSFYFVHNANPADPKFGNNIAKLLNEIIVNRGYSCVKYFIELNEPDYEGYFNDVNGHFPDYVKMIQNIDSAMKQLGIRNKIKFLGPDEACCGSYFVPTMESQILRNIFDGYDFHLYSAPSEVSSGGLWWRIEQYRDYVKNYAGSEGQSLLAKPQFITEAGNADGVSDSFSHALLMADYGTTVLNSRVQGAIAWNLFDIWYDQSTAYSTSEGASNYAMIPWGMWKYKDSNWKLRPYAQTWGLLTRFAPKGSLKMPIYYPGKSVAIPPPAGQPPNNPPNGNIRLGAITRPDGGINLFIVNRNSTTTNLQIYLPDSTLRTFDRYLVDQTTLGANPNKIIVAPSGNVEASGIATVAIPGGSFVVLVESAPEQMPAPLQIKIPVLTPTPVVTPISDCVPTPSNFCPAIGVWKFEEGGGNEVLDSSGFGNKAEIFGSGTQRVAAGKSGKAVSFNGLMGNFVHVTNKIMPQKAYSKSAWVNYSGGNSDAGIMGSGLGAVNHYFGIAKGGDLNGCGGVNGRLVGGHNGNYCSVSDLISFPTNKWTHVALTFDPNVSGGIMKLYRDGALVSTATNVSSIIDDPFINIGAWNYWSVWNGSIDSVRLYEYALTEAQVNADMNLQ